MIRKYPVSYTHLAVYKRQVFHHGSCDSLDRNAWCISSYIMGGPDADHFVFLSLIHISAVLHRIIYREE